MKWPDRETVVRRVREWAAAVGSRCPEVRRIGYFGSLSRGDWGVGSDVDLIVVVDATEAPFERRSFRFDTADLPVPADVLVYTLAEWEGRDGASRFSRTLGKEARWVYSREA